MPSHIRAAVLENGRLDIRSLPLRVPEGAIELEVAACGICGSDLRYLAGEDAWAAHTLGQPRRLPEAMVLGHEIAAWRRDDGSRRLVALIPFFTCGLCRYCRTGRAHLCAQTVHHGHGNMSTPDSLSFPGFAERTSAYPRQILEAPPGLPPEQLTVLDGLAVAIHALKVAHAAPGVSVAVVGVGPIGLSAVQAARAMGCYPVAAVDLNETAIARAQRLGASLVANASAAAREEICSRFQTELGQAEAGFDIVIDTSASGEGQRLCLDLLARGGTALFMAGLAADLDLQPCDLAGERTIKTSCNCRPEDYVLGLGWLASGVVNAEAMVTHVFTLDRIQEAFATAANKEETGACKVVVTMCSRS